MLTVSETVHPPISVAANSWERGLDPWHADAFPSEFKHVGTSGPRATGWYALDGFGNVIGFIADGTVIDNTVISGGVLWEYQPDTASWTNDRGEARNLRPVPDGMTLNRHLNPQPDTELPSDAVKRGPTKMRDFSV